MSPNTGWFFLQPRLGCTCAISLFRQSFGTLVGSMAYELGFIVDDVKDGPPAMSSKIEGFGSAMDPGTCGG
jgi:hypothetical protein